MNLADAIDLPAVRIGTPMLADYGYVAHRMREDERAQWCATTGREVYDAELCARTLALTPGIHFVLVGVDGFPFAVGGLEQIRPRVWQTWAAAVEGSWDTHWRTITRECRRQFRALFASGEAQRIETVALASRTRAREWYERGLGQRCEGTLRRYFADGQDGVIYACTMED